MCRQGVVVSRLSAVAETSPAFLCTFDLLELNGTDREPIAVRKATLCNPEQYTSTFGP
jgi:ATP-dependent DNA ligase